MAEHTGLIKAFEQPSDPTSALLRIASFEVFTTHTLAAVVANGLTHVSLRILELPVRRIGDAIANREADLGITYAPYPQRGLDFHQIGNAKFQIYGRKAVFRRTAFEDLPFAMPTTTVDGCTAGLLAIDGWPYERTVRNVRYELTSLESALALAHASCCVVFIPSFVAAAHNRAFPAAPGLGRDCSA
ncbi:MAG: DNA-binding transcriptional LysR family regulator [Gammaproteobacteria bacterium]|jgi:DNA-binding transcriptional LysR family regulator